MGVLRRNPYFEVIGFAGAEAHIAGAQDLTVRQAQQLQHFLGVTGHLFQRGHRVFRADDLHHFNFIELVHTDQTAGVAAIGTGFRAEARRMGGHFDRQIALSMISSRTRLVSGTSAVGIGA